MPIQGLVAYDDDPLSDHEDSSSCRLQSPPKPSSSSTDGDQLNSRPNVSSDHLNYNRQLNITSFSSKPALIIRRHPPAKPHPRTRLLDTVNDNPGPSRQPQTVSQTVQDTISVSTHDDDNTDELTRIRQLLRPPPIPGVQDWDIPPESAEPCDETIKAKIANFLALKRDPQRPRHFNDSLMANRAFRNPHLYTKLVEFVDVDERTTNFQKHIWDPLDVKDEWYADRIAEAQKARSEASSAAQQSSKRSRIDFTSGPSTSSHPRPDSKHARHQPYNVPNRPGGAHRSNEGVLGGGYGKGRERSRWG